MFVLLLLLDVLSSLRFIKLIFKQVYAYEILRSKVIILIQKLLSDTQTTHTAYRPGRLKWSVKIKNTPKHKDAQKLTLTQGKWS